ncbi:MAG: LppX_LprAFG lipoprotein [Chloroflexota bacterium]
MLARITPVLLLIAILVLAACGGDAEEDEIPQDPQALLRDAATLIQEAETFRLEVIPSGAPFVFLIDLGDGSAEVQFNRAIGQYAAPDEIQATINVTTGVPIDIEIYADGAEQWFRAPLIGWVNEDFAPLFDPARLLAEGGGFEVALAALRNLEYIGRETINGIATHHLSGSAEGAGVTDLLVGLIEIEGDVPIDVFLDRATGYPVRLVIEQPGTAIETAPNTTWQVDVFDVNAPDEIARPEGA